MWIPEEYANYTNIRNVVNSKLRKLEKIIGKVTLINYKEIFMGYKNLYREQVEFNKATVCPIMTYTLEARA